MIKHCEICGREFVAKRSTAKYCSDRCRIAHHRGGIIIGVPEQPNLTVSMTDEEVSGIIQQAHATASDLSRASLYTPSPLCLKLRTVARKLESALRGEGL